MSGFLEFNRKTYERSAALCSRCRGPPAERPCGPAPLRHSCRSAWLRVLLSSCNVLSPSVERAVSSARKAVFEMNCVRGPRHRLQLPCKQRQPAIRCCLSSLVFITVGGSTMSVKLSSLDEVISSLWPNCTGAGCEI